MNNIRKSLANLWPSIRISLVLVLITNSIILFADLCGFIPNQAQYELENRKQYSESLAVLFSAMAADRDLKNIREVVTKIVAREDNILSAGFRAQSGRLLFETGSHTKYWGNYQATSSTTTHVLVPIFIDDKQIGAIELRFKDLVTGENSYNAFNNATYKLILFVIIFGFFSFLFFIVRTLRQIDPAAVVPDRVNNAFDTLSEGVVILDEKEYIVMANKAFAEIFKREANSVFGFKPAELGLTLADDEAGDALYPWLITMATGESSVGNKLNLNLGSGNIRTLMVNCAPINDGKGNQQGILLTFDDVTELELQKQQLQITVSDLESSKKEIQRQNNELYILATRDPLTGSLNRRAFYAQFDELFAKARANAEMLCCIMVDIDHFKKVNDNYGHGVGDEVIKLLANILQSSTRDLDIVGRYGGEEFCIVLPGLDIDEAVSVAERIRLRVKNESASTFPNGPRVTASLGVATILDMAKDPAELNDQADQALYVAKESGRNRVVRWTANTEAKGHAPVQIDGTTVPPATEQRIPISDHSKHLEEISRLQIQINQLENISANFAEQLEHEQNYDKLTGLPNQSLFYDRIIQAVDISHRRGLLTAVLIVDVDFYTQASNCFGKATADELFSAFSLNLVSHFRKSDSIALLNADAGDGLVISRFEGEQFGVLITDIDDRTVVPWVVQRFFDIISQPVIHQEQELNVSCKIGISIFPDDAVSADELLNHANTAKSYAKKSPHENSYQFFDAEMQKVSIKQLALESEIRRGIKNHEWLLYYQPKMDIASKQIKGMEALIRWNHPSRGILAPFEFIGLAEQRGLIVPIGEWVIRTACKQAKQWADQGFDIKVAVNLSAIQFRQDNFAELILDIINETQVQPKHLELEVTETMLMNNLDSAIDILNRLHTRDICISIDDFGTGYSSLGYLKQLPLDNLKIDRMFIKDIITDEYDKNIVSTVISLAHGLNLKVIAEGVENQDQFDLLKTMACDEIQGYLLSKPVPAENATTLLQEMALKPTQL